MDDKSFMRIVYKGQIRSNNILTQKKIDYTDGGEDRLIHFKTTAEADPDSNPAQEVKNMASKHWSAIILMSKRPTKFTLDQWQEKLDDLRNYTHLLEGVLIDIGVN